MIKNTPWTRGSTPSTTCGLCSDAVTPVPGRHTITRGSSEALHSGARQTQHHAWQLRGPSLRCPADTPSRTAAQRPFTPESSPFCRLPPTPLRKDKSILTDAQTWTLRIALISLWLTPHARSLHSLSAVLSKYIRDSPVPCCCCLVAKSRLPLCDPVGCSPPGFSVHGISQARILE